MIVEELYIDGKKADIKDVSIVRNYKTPFFSDFDKIMSDSTYSIKLPETENNKAIMEYLNEPDMNTDFPYKYHSVEYIVDGIAVITNGKAYVSGDFEIQVVYGFDKSVFSQLKAKKLTDLFLFSISYILKWNPASVVYNTSGYDWNYFNYTSLEISSDRQVSGGVVYNKIPVPSPFNNGVNKKMATNPCMYISKMITNYIDTVAGITNNGLSSLKTIFNNYVLLLSNNKANTYIEVYEYVSVTTTSKCNVLAFNENDSVKVAGGATVTSKRVSVTGGTINYSYISIDSTKDQIDSLSDVSLNARATIKIIGAPTGVAMFLYRCTAFSISANTLNTENAEYVLDVPFTQQSSDTYRISTTLKFNVEKGYLYFVYFAANTIVTSYQITAGTNGFYISQTLNKSFFSLTTNGGVYDISANLPNITCYQFLNNLLTISGKVMTYVNNNKYGVKLMSYSNFKQNIINGNVYDWSGKVQKNVKNSQYRFSSNSQHNRIKPKNYEDIKRDYDITVSDETLDYEKDLSTLDFNISTSKNGTLVEAIQYKQKVTSDYAATPTVTFANEKTNLEDVVLAKYVGENLFSCDITDIGGTEYTIYQKLINRPIVKEVSVLLDVFETTNIDFEKPIYISEWGKYCMLLELTAPNKGLCTAKLLLINQTL